MSKPTINALFPSVDDKSWKVFITPAWHQHAELLNHLSQFSQNVLLVLGPKDAGKSTFLEYFMGLGSKSMQKHVLSASPEDSIEALMKRVAEGFRLDWEGVQATPHKVQSSIEETFDSAQATWVLLIDDAHLLTDEQLQALLQLVKFDIEPRRQLHLVFLGEPSLELRLFSPEMASIVNGKVYTIELEAWTLHDVKTFLAKDISLPRLSADQVEFIFETSHGLPGAVVRERDAIAEQTTIVGTKMKSKQIKKLGMHPVSLGVMVGVVVGGAYLLFNNTLEEELNGTPVNAAQMTENSWTEQDNILPKKSQAVAFHFDDQNTTTQDEIKRTDENQERTMPLANNLPTADEVLTSSPATTTVETTSTTGAKQTTVIEDPHPTQTLQKTPMVKEAPVAEKDKTSLNQKFSKEEEHLLSSNKSHYTLQLLGARKPESIKAFIQKHALNDKAYSFKTTRAGKDWYVVVYGDYPSAKEAKAAIDGIPDSLKKDNLQPWVREFQGVHEDIRQHRQG